jgi:hypothetical protein
MISRREFRHSWKSESLDFAETEMVHFAPAARTKIWRVG